MEYHIDKDKLITLVEEGYSLLEISKILGKTHAPVYKMARKLGIIEKALKKNVSPGLKRLLEDTPEAYYWLGFILADGCFMKPKGRSVSRLSVGVSKKDRDHLLKYSNFIKFKGKINKSDPSTIVFPANKSGVIQSGGSVTITSTNSQIVPKIASKLGVSERKTYNPPKKLPKTKDSLLTCLLIGFIDGDGSICSRNNGYASISITSYKAWEHILLEFKSLLKRMTPKENILISYEKEQVILSINNAATLRELKLVAEKFNLPVLERKWKRINILLTSLRETHEAKKEKILTFYKKGISPADISRITEISVSHVHRIIKRVDQNGDITAENIKIRERNLKLREEREVELITELMDTGLSQIEIAKRIDRSKSYVDTLKEKYSLR